MKKYSYLYVFFVLIILSSCQRRQKEDSKSEVIKEITDSNVNVIVADIENRSVEDSLTESLVAELQTRLFPTEQEIEMWRLITDDNVNHDNLPLLGRALVRTFFGTNYWGEDGEPELKNNSKAFCPVNIDMTGDYGWYALYPDSIWISSLVGTYSPNDILKGGLMNPWHSTEGNTKGITLNFKFDVSTRRLDGISLNNGYCHTEEQWNSHGRVAKLQLLVDGVPYKTVDLEDTPFRQMLPIDSIPASARPEPVDVTLLILEVYPGTKYNDVSIGNLYFSSSVEISSKQSRDLSHTVILPDSIPTDEVMSWFSDELLEEYKSHRVEIDDRWIRQPEALGFMGPGYQRFEIHFLTAERQDSLQYKVTGKTRYKGEIMPFDGEITIDRQESFDLTEPNEYSGFKEISDVGYLYGHYNFTAYLQNAKEPSTRIKKADFYGKVRYEYIVHAGEIYYNGLMMIADGYENNQYEGFWVDAETKNKVVCNWGDFRIPNSQTLDVGCGEFCPSDSAIQYYGWDTYIESLSLPEGPWWE